MILNAFLFRQWRSRACRSIVGLSLLLADVALAGVPAEPAVELLRHPYPYRAAVTISSDSHEVDRSTGEMSVERFEAIHVLLNTESRIERGSRQWRQLFADPAIEADAEWEDGVDGFGLPIGDTFTFYYPTSGLFEHFDPFLQRAVPQFHEGVDYRDIMERWIRQGWIDALHTGGPGHVPREAMRQGLEWLEQRGLRIEVWIDHSFGSPCAIEPDSELTMLEIVSKNFLKAGLGLVDAVGAGDPFVAALRRIAGSALADRIAIRLARGNVLGRFPAAQRMIGWVLGVFYAIALGAVLLCIALSRLRTPRNLLASASALFLVVLALEATPARYAQGDNPDSPYYHLDLVRQAGFRYFWLILDTDEYTHVVPQLALPERIWNGRSTFFRSVTVDDGSRLLVFPRSKLGHGGRRSLHMLTADGLEALVASQGTSILMTHLLSDAPTTFTAPSLRGLARLRDHYRAGRIWVAPSAEILAFEFARTFLDYSHHLEGGVRIIDIAGIDDPHGELIPASPDDLRGVSFRVRGSDRVEVRLAGKILGEERYERIRDGDALVVRFPRPDPVFCRIVRSVPHPVCHRPDEHGGRRPW